MKNFTWIGLLVACIGLNTTTLFAQDASQAIFYIQTLDANGQPLGGGTGFFVDAKGTGITHRNNFIGAASAQLITADSSIYAIERITGEDAATGLVRFQATGLSGDVASLKTANQAPKEGTSVEAWSADGPIGA
ncbi:MAG TPA: hypothetical protein DCP28_00930, partial [Cytophagales bacterium]|nr:hypothetical protein [Cytophagales bacterium]